MKNVFFILFTIACICYSYGSVKNIEVLKLIGLYTTIPFLLVHYLINTKKVELLYLLALAFIFIGDNSFHFEPDKISREVLTIVAFIFVSSFFTLLILIRKKFSGFKQIILIALPVIVLFLAVNFILFKDTKQVLYATGVYFISQSILCATSIAFYTEAKTKESLYFLIGSIGFFCASIAKGFEYIEKTPVSIMVNILFYVVSSLYFVKGVTEKYNKTETTM